jgi:hypothetical protein
VCGQTPGPFGIVVVCSYNGRTVPIFRSDSIIAWGYDDAYNIGWGENGSVFVQPATNQPTLRFPAQNFICFEYSPYEPGEYLVLRFPGGVEASFFISPELKINWKNPIVVQDKNRKAEFLIDVSAPDLSIRNGDYGYV